MRFSFAPFVSSRFLKTYFIAIQTRPTKQRTIIIVSFGFPVDV